MKTLLIVGVLACSCWIAHAAPVELGSSIEAHARLKVPAGELQPGSQHDDEPESAKASISEASISEASVGEASAIESQSPSVAALSVSELAETRPVSADRESFELESSVVEHDSSFVEHESTVGLDSSGAASEAPRGEKESPIGDAQSFADKSDSSLNDADNAGSALEGPDKPDSSLDDSDTPGSVLEEANDDAGDMPAANDDDGNGARFTGMLPSEMFNWIQGESVREGDPDDQQPATADEDDLKREADDLRTDVFASDIIAAMEGA